MKLPSFVGRFWQDDRGQDLIEYSLLAVFISIVAIATIQSIGTDVNTLYETVGNQIEPPAN